MKKRSLVAALAMLMVSAIVLTSSTYAWFATATTAKVTGVNASIENAAGSIYVSANKTDWSSSLTATDLAASGTITQTLTTVSYDPTDDAFFAGQFGTGELATTFTLTGAEATTGFNRAKIYLKAEQAGTVTVSPSLAGNMTGAEFIYASVKVGNDQVFLGAANDSYYPISPASLGTNGTAYDTNPQNGIIDTAEISANGASGCELGSQVQVSANQSITFDVSAYASDADIVEIEIYLWAEGQDTDCVGVKTAAPEYSLSFSYSAA